ncbi:SPOR domain-containing protein [Phaeodactylibacter xiamenensis]|uniref:SPOR domain-containing protein n=1 Tax=Phaeodactylibacter xiamenensis TaxID=1524460 RepID=UPI0024A94F03|nr:SPOR domain-containing protein [Phaeodactylibacter xiamenensis]
MSRLDYVTIAIVAVCVAALVYLIYMTTNLLGSSPEAPATADQMVSDPEDEYAEEEYYPEDTTATFDDGYYDEGGAAVDNTGEGDQAIAEEDAPNYEDADSDLQTSSSRGPAKDGRIKPDFSSVASGQYMVLAGTFKYRNNAEEMVSKLKGMGYANASVELFDRGRYAVALVDRFDGLASAQALKSELSGKGVEAYVKQK